MENPIKVDDLGVPLLLGNTHKGVGELIFFGKSLASSVVFLEDDFPASHLVASRQVSCSSIALRLCRRTFNLSHAEYVEIFVVLDSTNM